LFEIKNPDKASKVVGDIASTHRGLSVIVDTTWTSKKGKSPETASQVGVMAEKQKRGNLPSIKARNLIVCIGKTVRANGSGSYGSVGSENDEIFSRGV